MVLFHKLLLVGTTKGTLYCLQVRVFRIKNDSARAVVLLTGSIDRFFGSSETSFGRRRPEILVTRFDDSFGVARNRRHPLTLIFSLFRGDDSFGRRGIRQGCAVMLGSAGR